MKNSGLHDRLVAVVGNRSYREISELTGTHHETIRRFMNGQAPSVEFLHALCRSMKINAHWLLMGVGPMRTGEMKGDALRQADPGELLEAVAETIETLIDRVDLIERFVQTLETRLRGRSDGPQHQRPASPDIRVPSVADALAQRAPQGDR